jgi:putative lipoprotein
VPRQPRLFFLLATASLIASSAPRVAFAGDPDPWWGRDKALHFGASATIAAGSYGLGSLVLDGRAERALFGGGVALLAGVGKETLDLAGYGDPSWKDLAWDGIGTLVGVGLALSIDLAVGRSKSRSTGEARGAVVTW